jgi:hypothetical protein
VLGAGALGPSPLFDTVSYGPVLDTDQVFGFAARHDALGLGGARCEAYASSAQDAADPPRPTGCYAGDSGPPPGTELEAGEVLTWVAAGDDQSAFEGSHVTKPGDSNNCAKEHGGWELCFA